MDPEIVVPIFSAMVSGVWVYLERKVAHQSPKTVAEGYTILASDLRLELNRINARVKQLEQERVGLKSQIGSLNQQVRWLLRSVEEVDRIEFMELFSDEEEKDGE